MLFVFAPLVMVPGPVRLQAYVVPATSVTSAVMAVVFGQTSVGPWIAMGGLVSTPTDDDAAPHAVVTVTPSETNGIVPAVNVMLLVPWPAVIVPAPMVQA